MSLIRSVKWLANGASERYLAATAAFRVMLRFFLFSSPPSPLLFISPVDSAGSLFFPGRFLRALFSFPPPSVFLYTSTRWFEPLQREREKDRCIGCPRTDDINGDDSDIQNI